MVERSLAVGRWRGPNGWRARTGNGIRTLRHPGVAVPAATVLCLVVAAVVGLGQPVGDDVVVRLADVLRALSALLFFGAGVLCVAGWRVVDEPRGTLLGAALIVFGALTLPVQSVAGLLHTSGPTPALTSLSRALVTVVVLGLVVVALRVTAGASRLRVGSLTLLIAGFTSLCLVGLVVLSQVSATGLDLVPQRRMAIELTTAAAWFGAATVATLSNRPARSSWASCAASVLALMGIGSVFRAAAAYDSIAWTLAAATMTAVAAVVVLASVWVSSDNAASTHQQRREEIAHDARNAVAALRMASTTLSRHGDSLDAETREKLRAAMLAEVGQLEYLIDRHAYTAPVDFDLGQVLGQIVQAQRVHGLDVELHLAHCWAHGRPGDVAAAVQNLLVNARLHAPDSAVTIRAYPRGPRMEICVEDGGPGIPAPQQEAVFARGARDAASGGSGLGLHITRTLMRAQGGDIVLVDRPSGGAAFLLTLPLAVRSPAASDAG